LIKYFNNIRVTNFCSDQPDNYANRKANCDKQSQTDTVQIDPQNFPEWNDYILKLQEYYQIYYQNAYFNNRSYYKNNTSHSSI
jgi:hypothetical protein